MTATITNNKNEHIISTLCAVAEKYKLLMHGMDSRGSKGSSIHARFVDLSTRDRFLANAKKLARSKQKGISISVDVPPCLRKVRKELADLRKGLPDERKRRSFIKHLPSWPYFQLQEKADDNVITVTKHSFSRETVALSALQSSMKELAGPLDFVIK